MILCYQSCNEIINIKLMNLKPFRLFFLISLSLCFFLLNPQINPASEQQSQTSQTQILQIINPTCFIQTSGQCEACVFGFYSTQDICESSNVNCKSIDSQNGNCISCFMGYSHYNATCNQDKDVFLNQGCTIIRDSRCLVCAPGYYIGETHLCQLADTLCKVFDNEQQICKECFDSYHYRVNENRCVFGSQTVDHYCQHIIDGECQKCRPGFNLKDKICTQIIPHCKIYDQKFDTCKHCHNGYLLILQSNTCQKDKFHLTKYLCAIFNQDGSCSDCIHRSYLKEDNTCELVNPLCQDYNQQTGQCKSCFLGFKLANGLCQNDGQTSSCAQWEGSNCIACVPWSYFDQQSKICKRVSDLCRTYSNTTGKCMSCYEGYSLNEGICFVDLSSTDTNCRQSLAQKCIGCYNGYFLDKELSKCKLSNPLCREIDDDNGCQSCYQGYSLKEKQCIIEPILQNKVTLRDPNCEEGKLNEGCINCTDGYFSNANGWCQKTEEKCNQYNLVTKKCQVCVQGFKPVDGNCFNGVSSNNITNPKCKTFQTGICTQCSSHSFMNNFGLCTSINQFCLTYSRQTGSCLTCFQGYILESSTCVIDTFSIGCAFKPQDSNICQGCYTGYFLDNGRCKQIDPFCRVFDEELKICEDCYLGYMMMDGLCRI